MSTESLPPDPEPKPYSLDAHGWELLFTGWLTGLLLKEPDYKEMGIELVASNRVSVTLLGQRFEITVHHKGDINAEVRAFLDKAMARFNKPPGEAD